MAALIKKSQVSRTSHDPITIASHGHGRDRAVQEVQKELQVSARTSKSESESIKG